MAPLRLRWGRWVLAGALTLCLGLVFLHEAVTRRAYENSVRTISEVTNNATPSLVQLTELRRTVREVTAELAAQDEHEVAWRLRARWPVIDAHLNAFLDLPGFPGEEPTRRRLVASLRRLRAAEDRLLLEAAGSPTERGAEHDVIAAAQDALSTLDELVVDNARGAAEAADAVALAHARASALSLGTLAAIALAFSVAGAVSWTVLRRLEVAAERRLDELDAFAGRVAHDLKGPLHPALLAASLLEREALSPAGERTLARLEGSLRRASQLVDGLLAFARAGARPAPGARADLDRVLAELTPALRHLADDEAATLTFDVEPELALAAEPAVVGSILENLVRNAILYLGPAPRRVVTVAGRAEDGRLLLEVADTGPGIPDDLLRRLFRPFERGSDRPGGSGLGLATVKRLVEAHGGAVELRTRVGAGTTFVVRLPLAEATRAPAAADRRAQDAAARAP